MLKIAVVNAKGGVGKSTTSVNLAYGLATFGNQKTLLMDLDPGAQSSEIYGSSNNNNYTIKDLFFDQNIHIKDVIQTAHVNGKPVENLDVVMSSRQFTKVIQQVSSRIHREKILHNHLRKDEGSHYVGVMDCSASLDVVTINAIYTADLVVVPIIYGKGALNGMADLLKTIKEVKENEKFLYRILRNKFDCRTTQTNAYIDAEIEPYKENLLATSIRRTEAINQSHIAGEPIFTYDARSNGSADYKAVTQEIIELCRNYPTKRKAASSLTQKSKALIQ